MPIKPNQRPQPQPGENPKKVFRAMTAGRGAPIYRRLKEYLKSNPDLSVSGQVRNSSRYCYSTAPTLTIEIEGVLANGEDWDSDPQLGQLADSVQKDMEEWAHSFNKEMEKAFYKELEYRQSEEALSETWDANDIKFDEDGDMISSQVVNGRIDKTGLEFGQLSPEAKEHALDKYRYWDTEDNEWSTYMEDDYKQQLASMGFDRVEIQYSLGYGQGDGACFTAGSIDVRKFIDAMFTGRKPTDIFNEAKALVAEMLA